MEDFLTDRVAEEEKNNTIVYKISNRVITPILLGALAVFVLGLIGGLISLVIQFIKIIAIIRPIISASISPSERFLKKPINS